MIELILLAAVVIGILAIVSVHGFFSLAGWTESQDTAGILTEVAAIPDQHITTENDDIVVPEWASNLIAALPIGATISQAQISSPSLRKNLLVDCPSLDMNVTPQGFNVLVDLIGQPKKLEPSEGLRALVAEAAGGAEQDSLFVWLADKLEDMPAGEVVWVRCTSTTTLTPYAWSLCNLAFTQQLPAGKWAIVGARMFGATAIVFRFVLPGSAHRPGGIAWTNEGQTQVFINEPGVLGKWGEFDHRFPPQMEVLAAAADTSQVVYLALVKLE